MMQCILNQTNRERFRPSHVQLFYSASRRNQREDIHGKAHHSVFIHYGVDEDIDVSVPLLEENDLIVKNFHMFASQKHEKQKHTLMMLSDDAVSEDSSSREVRERRVVTTYCNI